MAETSPLPSSLSFSLVPPVATCRESPPRPADVQNPNIRNSEIPRRREPSGFEFRDGLLGNGSPNFRFLRVATWLVKAVDADLLPLFPSSEERPS